MPPDANAFPSGYRAALESAALFDRPEWGHVDISGPEAPKFLHNLSTNAVEQLPLGAGCEAYFCSAQAKALNHGFIFHCRRPDGEHYMLVQTDPGQTAKFLAHSDRHWISEQIEIKDRSAELASFHVAGPTAADVLGSALGSAVPPLADLQHLERDLAGATVQLRRNDRLGVPGYDVIAPAGSADAVREAMSRAGAVAGSDADFESLRVEANTPTYGIDVTETRFVMEAPNPLRAVSYAKGCYLGQEPIVMARDRAGFVNRTLMRVVSRGVEPVPAGSKLFAGPVEVGLTASSAYSPRRGAAVALAYLRRGHQQAGSVFEAKGPGGEGVGEVEVL